MKKRDKKLEQKLMVFNQTRERTPMPRPTVFKDKSKYNRNRRKANDRREAWAPC